MTGNHAEQTPADPFKALRELANSPRLVKVVNTQTTAVRTVKRSANTSSTSVLDVRELAESVMFDATRLVATLDEFAPTQSNQEASSRADMVAIPAVLRGGAAITCAFALLCLVGSQLSGTVFLHPLLAWLLIISSVGFYLMALPRRR